MYQPKHLKRWTMPQNYFGSEWPEYYGAGIGQHRDSDALTRSNFRSLLSIVGGESETVMVVRENHWAVGWVEWIAIHESDDLALEKADDAMERYQDYPVLDEDDFTREEDEEAQQVWTNCYDNSERVQYIREHRNQFEFRDFSDLMKCARGEYFNGYASELIT